MMTIDQFNYKYGSKGGFAQLYKMLYDDSKTQYEIAAHFGVTQPGVRGWIKDLFGRTPDTRLARRARRVNAMIEYMRTHTEYEASQVFRYENEDYYTEAVFLAYKQGIYGERAVQEEKPPLNTS